MFYAESLLCKSGKLAYVWQAANSVDRKLSKSYIVQSDIQSSVDAIVDQSQAPLALRLSGQLLLGVVRIYGRKARYLLDDCNDTTFKLSVAFKNTSNNDLVNQHVPVSAITLENIMSEEELLASFSNPFNLSQIPGLDLGDKPQDLSIDWTSTLTPQKSSQSRLTPEERPHFEDDTGLELDLGEDLGFGDDTSMSIEVGRHAPAGRSAAEDLFSDDGKVLGGDDLDLDLGEDIAMPDQTDVLPSTEYDNMQDILNQEDGMTLGGVGDDEFQIPLDNTPRLRNSASLVSDQAREGDATFAIGEEETEIAAQQPQRSKKRKLIPADVETVLHNSQIKKQEQDTSAILKPASFLPKDPFLLTLMAMQRNGDFVSNIMLDGRSQSWAPELRGLLSFDAVSRASGHHKRKRDSGIADISGDERGSKSPRLEEDDVDEGVHFDGDMSGNQIELGGDVGPMSDGLAAVNLDHGANDDDGIYAGDDGAFGFDDTTMPLIHPADSGPVSLQTKHAVHLLRERFGGSNPDLTGTPSSQVKKSVLFQELLPEGGASREDATKMFFEVLVLATKDAIKVEQSDKDIGMPLRIRGKRGLWGSWAETRPEGENELPTQAQAQAQTA